MMSFALSASKQRGGLTKAKYPNLYSYTERLESFESHQRAVQKIIDIDGVYSATL